MVELKESALSEIFRHAHAEAPNECCGLLVGEARCIERAVRARNLEASPTRYLIDPADHFAAIRDARAAGRTVVGAYHSHPASAPVPSPVDLSKSTSSSDFVHVIVSLAAGLPGTTVSAYCLTTNGVEAVELQIVA